MPKTVDTGKHCEVGLRTCNSLPKTEVYGERGLQKVVACSQSHLAVPSCVNSLGTVSSLRTSYFIFNTLHGMGDISSS